MFWVGITPNSDFKRVWICGFTLPVDAEYNLKQWDKNMSRINLAFVVIIFIYEFKYSIS